MKIDVALVPAETRHWRDEVCVMVDELRSSSTITTLLDLGCSRLFLTRSLAEARRLGREHNALLAGERKGRTPAGFHFNNSPVELSQADVRGRTVVLSTANGTRVLNRLRNKPLTLIGCLLNARACARAAVSLALSRDTGLGLVCAGEFRRFALDDAVTAGLLVSRMIEAAEEQGVRPSLSDAAKTALRLQASYSDLEEALRDSSTGRLVCDIGDEADIPFCARVDATTTVPVLRGGPPLLVERLATG
jgi:2-phosphosulfolactate phosphatase